MESRGIFDRRGMRLVANRGELGASCVRAALRHRTPSGFLLIVGVLLCLGLVSAAPLGCGPGYPPDRSIAQPVVAMDGQGDLLVAYQVNEGRNPVTYVQKLAPDGKRLWGEKGVRLDDRQPESPIETPSSTHMVVDKHGSATVFWEYEDQIFSTKLDGDGKRTWDTPRVRVGAFGELGGEEWEQWAVVAGSADATVIWIDADKDLHLQRIDGNGSLLWPDRAVAASARVFDATSDQVGDTWVMWADASTGAISPLVFGSAGEPVWEEAKELQQGCQPASPGVTADAYRLWVAEDGVGEVLAAWWNRTAQGPLEVRSCTVDGKIRVDVTGRYLDGMGGMEAPGLVGDEQGGLFAFWTTSDSILAQRIDGQGRTVWGENGLPVVAGVASTDTGNEFTVNGDRAGGAVVSWEADTAAGPVWRVQSFDSAGRNLWPSSGIGIGAAFTGAWWSVTKADGAVVFSYVAGEDGGDTERESYIQKVDADGNLPWGADGIRLDDWR